MSRFLLHPLLAAVVALALGACASTSVQPGMSRGEVVTRMGQPSSVLPLEAGTRLQYSRQPAGQQVFNVDLDASGRVVQFRQMLVAEEFQRIGLGQWTRADVERSFGPPAFVEHAAHWPGDILTYRWSNGQDMFYWIYLDANNVVRRAEPGVQYYHDD
nr:hypothetical protein [uncultured Rhodoferax sp.]